MARTTVIPSINIIEEIRSIEEVPGYGVTRGIVKVVVGVVDEKGDFIVPQQLMPYMIEGDHYDELVGPPQSWAPDKPAGTYRNQDLWHFIDILRAPKPAGEQQ